MSQFIADLKMSIIDSPVVHDTERLKILMEVYRETDGEPPIPEHNDSTENMRDLARFASGLGVQRIDILPYHQLGVGKYKRLGLKYPLADLKSLEKEHVDSIKRDLESYGLEIAVV